MPEVELIYDRDCPNVAAARTQLLHAFAKASVQARWREWQADDPESPPHVRGFGSPTILVDGRDVAGTEPAGGACCRVYAQPDRTVRGVPSVEVIAGVLASASRPVADAGGRAGGWKSHLAMLPGIGAALLPKIACPACWPAYAGFLSAIGLGFLINTTYLLPLTAAFLAIAVGALGFRPRQRRGYGPFLVGLLASTVVLVGKFHFESDATMYGGLALLVAASLWNSWPRKPSTSTCPSCAEGNEPPIQPVR